MAVLLDLSPELITAILEYLAPVSESLDNICLVGNHNLLTLARPYTWREINITFRNDRRQDRKNQEASQALADRLHGFCCDSTKVAAVRSLNITLVGVFDNRAPAVLELFENYQRFVNVTHASVCCIRSNGGLWAQPRFITSLVEGLPSLLSLSVDGCLDSFHRGPEIMADHPIPPLRHLAVRFCNTEGVGGIWSYCSNLQVVEMAGGRADRFLQRNTSYTSEEIQNWLDDPSNCRTGAYDILYKPKETPERSAVFDTATTVKLVSDSEFSNYCDSEAWFLLDYFEERENQNFGPSPSLKEFVLDFFISVKIFRGILYGIRSPVIERVAFTGFDEKHWIPAEFDEFIAEISKDGGLFFSSFQSLTELLLPCDGILPETLNLFPSLLAHAPTLRYLYFGSGGSDRGDLIPPARKYAGAISTLQSVSWRNKSTFHIIRDSGVLGPPRLRETPYAAPSWQQWNGIGKWWEIQRAAT
ncbi:hypothetical protein MSAN_00659600 [Mycena sanguinolenta]|uniref:Uncharacterized protein n=1 Tax=Mycena sanguinolenta TaxID=230812 RepID=A0A8H6Z140_9AGAR|nr:hypothetical protein MSAN_00659600 [Mycena sanguinolenta]